MNETIDETLDRLKGPTTADDRFRVLQELVEYWHGPIGPTDGLSETELSAYRMPALLRRWYRWAGQLMGDLFHQNHLLAPTALEVKDELLVFYGENQWVYEWATEFEGDDPPVFGRYNHEQRWEPEGVTLSQHLILASLFEGVITAPHGASAACLAEGKLAQIVETVPPIAVGPWRWIDARFYEYGGAFMVAAPNAAPNGVAAERQGFSVWLGAKTAAPLRFLTEFVDDAWEYVSI